MRIKKLAAATIMTLLLTVSMALPAFAAIPCSPCGAAIKRTCGNLYEYTWGSEMCGFLSSCSVSQVYYRDGGTCPYYNAVSSPNHTHGAINQHVHAYQHSKCGRGNIVTCTGVFY